jgi:hypothetical protein
VYADWCFKRWNKHNWVTTISRILMRSFFTARDPK